MIPIYSEREGEIHVEWLFDGFQLLSPWPHFSMCVRIYLFISSAVVNSFFGREPILPNGQVSIRWVRTLIARLMSWQERWVLSFDMPLIIRLPQERKLMLLVRKDETLGWEYFLMTVRVYIILNDTRLCILFVKIYIYIYCMLCLMCLWASALPSHYTNGTTLGESIIFFCGTQI